MGYLKFIARRLLISLVTILGIIIITFVLTRALPGDPVWLRLPPKATLEDYYEEKARLGLDKPIFYQLLVYIADLFTGNWGFSLTVMRDNDVWTLVVFYLPRSIELMFISMFIAIGLGIVFGKISARKVNSFWDYLIRFFMYLLLSIPGFVIIIFFVQLYVFSPFKIFPLYGYKSIYYPDPPLITGFPILDALISGQMQLFVDLLWHMIIPLSTMTIVQMVAIIRQTRSSLLEILKMDFIRTAKAKGCSNKTIINKHALKNAIPPVITISAMGFPIIIGGMIAIEVAYHYVGIGYMFREAVRSYDYPVIVTLIFIFSVIVITFNFIADLIVGFLDPRIRVE
ncbi:MAG: ABC transporter permease [Promethearchaeota archaeon]|nr:MAG: ABC transporter permease [Candidatus Lokiarchaeota archaeon]